MTTIAALKLELNAQQMRQETQGAKTDLDGVSKSAEAAGRAVDGMGRQVDAAARTVGTSTEAAAAKTKKFQDGVAALGEVTQINQRVRLLGEEVRNLGSGFSSAGTVASVFAQSLVDVAQISSKAEGSFGGLVGLLRANPLLAAAGVLSAIATAMSLFGGETEDTNEKLREQIKLQQELRQASVDLALQIQRNADLQRIGFQVDQKEQETLRARRLAEVASGLAGQKGFQSFADLTSLTGLSQSELTDLAGPRGVRQQLQEVVVPGLQTTRSQLVDVGLTNEAAREIILRVAQIFRNQAVFSPNSTAPVQGVVQAGQAGVSNGGYGFGGFGVLQPGQIATLRDRLNPPNLASDYSVVSQEQIFNVIAKRRDDEIRKLTEQLNQLKSLGQDVGTAIGGAFFSIVNGAANARQALAGLLQQFVAIAQQRAIQGIANSLGNAFGASTAQQISNVQSGGVNVPAQPGGGLAGGGIG
jgi:hypothetical protein